MVSARGLRRYPALLFLVAAGLLALLLPSSLRLPLSGPPSVAELAPVPARGLSDANGALSALGAASSGGLGGRAGGGGAAGGGATGDPLPAQHRPRGKRCVGNPPRQTEDPLSPPCVAYFSGDNGGSTARGVTKDEVTVVLSYDHGSSARDVRDLAEPVNDADRASNQWKQRAIKAYAHYFDDRFQAYGRRIHFWLWNAGAGDSAEQIRAMVGAIDAKLHPFAFVPTFAIGTSTAADEAARRGLLVTTPFSFTRAFTQSLAPKIMSYRPDIEDAVELASSYICRKLHGRLVKHGDASDSGKVRKFGILYSQRAEEPTYEQAKSLLVERLKAECGEDVPAVGVQGGNIQSGARDNELAMADLRTKGVTTVIVYSSDTVYFSNDQAWHPELFLPASLGGQLIDSNDFARLAGQGSWRNAFGMSFDIRRGAMTEQQWYQAYREQCADCDDPSASGDLIDTYEAMFLAAYAIQAAGPKLTVASVDKGMHAIPPRPSPNPLTPAAYFTPGNYSFVKDATEIWWDPAGTDPATPKPGCYRLPTEGRRFRAGEWPEGDDDLWAPGQPCQGSFAPR